MVQEIRPKVLLAENVRGLVSHDAGKTFDTMKTVLARLGYHLHWQLLNAQYYNVPQKRERLFIVGIRTDLTLQNQFNFPLPSADAMTLQEALLAGLLYDSDAPQSKGQHYSKRKAEILNLVPPGGCWRDLPPDLQREHMGNSYYSSGGRTGMARRLSWDKPCLTLTCSPAQKQTERCHPDETRPLTVREYARIQTFPDDWEFAGSLTSQYKQIGNAVPVNLGYAIGKAIEVVIFILELTTISQLS